MGNVLQCIAFNTVKIMLAIRAGRDRVSQEIIIITYCKIDGLKFLQLMNVRDTEWRYGDSTWNDLLGRGRKQEVVASETSSRMEYLLDEMVHYKKEEDYSPLKEFTKSNADASPASTSLRSVKEQLPEIEKLLTTLALESNISLNIPLTYYLQRFAQHQLVQHLPKLIWKQIVNSQKHVVN